MNGCTGLGGKSLTHINNKGKAQMVDVGDKKPQQRRACAVGKIYLTAVTLTLINNNEIKKGDVLTVAKIAGIQAAKRTHELIPLCHPLILDNIEVQLKVVADGVEVESEVKCIGRTGVEMEALTAVNIALLTIYDMCKAVDKNMKMGNIELKVKEKQDV